MRITVNYSLGDLDMESTSPRSLGAIKRRLADLSPAAEFVHQTMRFGPGSINDQFNREAEANGASWPKTKPFGTRPAPAKTLQRTGSLLSAWVGRAPGSVSAATPNSFMVGVDTNILPQAGVFQAQAPTIIRPRKKAKGGKGTAMHYFLGLTYGVWISEARLAAGLSIPPRRVAVGTEMQVRVGDLLTRWLIGEAPTRAEANLG